MSIGDVASRSRTRQEAADVLGVTLGVHEKSGQDCLVVDPERQLFAVADGVGGSEHGDIAARVACETFAERAPSYRLGLLAALEAMPELYAALQGAVKETKSQTTFTGGIITSDNHIAWLHAGDSRLFHLTPYGELYDMVPPQHDPFKQYSLYNALGSKHDQLVLGPNDYNQWMPLWGHEKLQSGDRLLFATDGIGQGGFEDSQFEALWWMRHASRELGVTALDALERVFDDSMIVDDGTLIIVDIDE